MRMKIFLKLSVLVEGNDVNMITFKDTRIREIVT